MGSRHWKRVLEKVLLEVRKQRFSAKFSSMTKEVLSGASRELRIKLIKRVFTFVYRNWSLITSGSGYRGLVRATRDKIIELRHQGLDLCEYEELLDLADISFKFPLKPPSPKSIPEISPDSATLLYPDILGHINSFLSYREYENFKAVNNYLFHTLKKEPQQSHGKYLSMYKNHREWRVSLAYDGEPHFLSCSDYCGKVYGSIGFENCEFCLRYETLKSSYGFYGLSEPNPVTNEITYIVKRLPNDYGQYISSADKRAIIEAIRIMRNDSQECNFQLFLPDFKQYIVEWIGRDGWNKNPHYPRIVADKIFELIADYVFDPRR